MAVNKSDNYVKVDIASLNNITSSLKTLQSRIGSLSNNLKPATFNDQIFNISPNGTDGSLQLVTSNGFANENYISGITIPTSESFSSIINNGTISNLESNSTITLFSSGNSTINALDGTLTMNDIPSSGKLIVKNGSNNIEISNKIAKVGSTTITDGNGALIATSVSEDTTNKQLKWGTGWINSGYKTLVLNGTNATGLVKSSNDIIARIPSGYYPQDGSNNYSYVNLTNYVGDATQPQVLKGSYFTSSSGVKLEGTMKNNGAITETINSNSTYTIPEGYHNGSGKITINVNTSSPVPTGIYTLTQIGSSSIDMGEESSNRYINTSGDLSIVGNVNSITGQSGYRIESFNSNNTVVGSIAGTLNIEAVNSNGIINIENGSNDVQIANKTVKIGSTTVTNSSGALTSGSASVASTTLSSSSTSLSGTTLTVQASVAPSITAGWITGTSGTAGTVKITGTVPTETKSATPSSTSQTISPSTGKLLSGVTVNAVTLDIAKGVTGTSNIEYTTTLPSGATSSGTIGMNSYIKVGKGYVDADKYYLAQGGTTFESYIPSNTYFTTKTTDTIVSTTPVIEANKYSANAQYLRKGSATTPATSVDPGAGSGSVASSTGLVTITSASNTKSVTPSVSAGWVSSGTAGTITVNSKDFTYQLPTTKAATTYNTSTSDQTISAGTYLTGTQTIKAVKTANISAGNIKHGVVVTVGDANSATRIANVTGSFYNDGSTYTLSSVGTSIDMGASSSNRYITTSGLQVIPTATYTASAAVTNADITGYGKLTISGGSISANTTLASGATANTTKLNQGSYIKIGKGYYANDAYYQVNSYSTSVSATDFQYVSYNSGLSTYPQSTSIEIIKPSANKGSMIINQITIPQDKRLYVVTNAGSGDYDSDSTCTNVGLSLANYTITHLSSSSSSSTSSPAVYIDSSTNTNYIYSYVCCGQNSDVLSIKELLLSGYTTSGTNFDSKRIEILNIGLSSSSNKCAIYKIKNYGTIGRPGTSGDYGLENRGLISEFFNYGTIGDSTYSGKTYGFENYGEIREFYGANASNVIKSLTGTIVIQDLESSTVSNRHGDITINRTATGNLHLTHGELNGKYNGYGNIWFTDLHGKETQLVNEGAVVEKQLKFQQETFTATGGNTLGLQLLGEPILFGLKLTSNSGTLNNNTVISVHSQVYKEDTTTSTSTTNTYDVVYFYKGSNTSRIYPVTGTITAIYYKSTKNITLNESKSSSVIFQNGKSYTFWYAYYE